jgi:hypothetical protein
MTLAFGFVIFLFWYIRYPQAMSYLEQYQLFLWTTDYFCESISGIGGMASYIGEFLGQFFIIEWAGATILAAIFISIALLVDKVFATEVLGKRNEEGNWAFSLLLGGCISVLMIWHMGDESVLLSYPVALILSMAIYLLANRLNALYDIVIIPVLYWFIGPVVCLYVALRHLTTKITIWPVVYFLAVHCYASGIILEQWPLQSALFGTNYYRNPVTVPFFQVLIPVLIYVLCLVGKYLEKASTRIAIMVASVCGFILFICADIYGYNKDKYELIKEAETYQVHVNFSSECVNLALAMTGQLSDRMFSFYQSGSDALVMPMVRDLTSNLPTMETFYRLGMVNESMRYAFDIQESILNGKKSGRLTKRMAECCIINGKYIVASKYLDMLSHSLFYSKWAKEAKRYLGNEAWIDAHPQWGKMRKMRYKDDFLYNYVEMDKMFGILFQTNPNNKMALEYFLAQLLLNGNVQGFMKYIGWAQQYGGYEAMPNGYQDAIRCIQAKGELAGSPYSGYVMRMVKSATQKEKAEENISAH